ncbi:hypothetical protein E2C01_019561 [Portunus trituberculatus]|uniref:Uncharacterized protein n=1 Tax=Portunus trituberculatus TaxID=210409 RepID=A0A5B7DZ63_PORTR|nr:hypothetical protein [Portunus trituberculatus]
MNMETRHGTEGFYLGFICGLLAFNPFSTGRHFYFEICARLDYLIDIRKCLWRSED